MSGKKLPEGMAREFMAKHAETIDKLFSDGMSCALEGEGERCLNCEAYRAGRAAGYAEAVADVVAMMRDHARRAENVMRKSHFDRGPFDSSTLQAGAYVRGVTWGLDKIDSGAHVGAAKKGGDK